MLFLLQIHNLPPSTPPINSELNNENIITRSIKISKTKIEITETIYASKCHTTELLTTKKPTYKQIDKQSQHIQLFL